MPLRFVGGLQHHCVVLRAVSTLLVRVFKRGLKPRRGPLVRPTLLGGHRSSCLSLCRLTSLTETFASCAARFARCYTSTSCRFHTLLPFTCADDSCLSCLHVAAPHCCEFCCLQSFFWVKPSLSAFTFAAVVLFLTWLRASFSAGTPRLRHVRKNRSVFMSDGSPSCSLTLSRASSTPG